EVPLDIVLKELEQRDSADASRAMAPLKPADDSIEIDTSCLSIEEQVSVLYDYVIDLLKETNCLSEQFYHPEQSCLSEQSCHSGLDPESNKLDSCLRRNDKRIRLAKHSGYCFGVRRAIQLAIEAKESNSKVFSLGELIHNPKIVSELQEMGIEVINQAAGVSNSTVIIRSHGISKQDFELLLQNNNTIIDATCPYVKRTHELIGNMAQEGCPIIILGDAHHPEVIGMLSYGNNQTIVMAPDDPIPANLGSKVCLISQTTQKLEDLQRVICQLIPQVVEFRIFNTICLATSQRQDSATELAKDSDLMIVVGGYNSSNTRALASLCHQLCPTHHIESEEELDKINLVDYKRIGICAGASTPQETIVKVFNKIIEKSGESGIAKCIEDIPLFKEESC
ncbi:MAG: 4-hydroxy-3-methylbut-2-enyl diphosphate reductase, partial [Candidatus Cloacimonetes bacterium]|nr:4-hydroxy-3-methylbut-2-enyl diphosphate reductase [Candidatus Cloacimonadota bacterium]